MFILLGIRFFGCILPPLLPPSHGKHLLILKVSGKLSLPSPEKNMKIVTITVFHMFKTELKTWKIQEKDPHRTSRNVSYNV